MSVTSSAGGRAPIPPPSNNTIAILLSDELLIMQAELLLVVIEGTLKRHMRRCKYFYGVHFPELNNIIKKNSLFFRVVKRIGKRENLPNVDLSDLLTPVLKFKVIKAAMTTKGVNISDEDMDDINSLCDHIRTLLRDRAHLNYIIETYMKKLVPNLTRVVGVKIGAKMIAHATLLISIRLRSLSGRSNERSIDSKNESRETTRNRDGTVSIVQCGIYGKRSSHDHGTTAEDSVKSNQSAEDNEKTRKLILEDETDDESKSKVEEKPAKGAYKAVHQN